jgi:hypothetical protein
VALTEYDNMPVKYEARFYDGMLVVTEVTPHIYMRIGTDGLADSKIEAVEILKLSMMNKFLAKFRAIDWQAMQFVRTI